MDQSTTAQVSPVQLHRSNYRVGRNVPAKPAQPEVKTRTANTDEVLDIFNQFVSEARKELRKREQLTVKGAITKTDCDLVTFIADTFSLTIDFKGGMAV